MITLFSSESSVATISCSLMLRLCTPSLSTDPDAILRRVAELERKVAQGVVPAQHKQTAPEAQEAADPIPPAPAKAPAAEKTAEKLGVNTAPTIDKLLDTVDAVSICVPTQFHKDTAMQVLESGVAALIEKPVCSTVFRSIEKLPETRGRCCI